VAGNPFGAATAGGIIGGIMVSSWRIAKALLTLASVRIVLASVSIVLASVSTVLASNGANAAAIAPANHGGATCSPANLWTTYQKTYELNE
jgi:hypothetical protein